MAPGTDEDNVGALAEAVWSEKEIMMVLDDKVPSMVEISRGSFPFMWHPMSNGACLGFGTNPLSFFMNLH